jgi:hypothetical protein
VSFDILPSAMERRWGLRGRVVRRLVFAWVICATTTAAWLDGGCCCCDCRGMIGGVLVPDRADLDTAAAEFLRSSEEVRAQTGEVRSFRVMDDEALGLPDIHTRYDGDEKMVYTMRFSVVGERATIELHLYLRRGEDGEWEVIAAAGIDGTTIYGEIPPLTVGSGSGGDWD